MIRRTVNALGDGPRPRMDAQWLVNGDIVPGALGMLLVQALSKGAELPVHTLPAAESVTFLLSGKGEWSAPREPWPLAPGQGVYNPSESRRAFRATDDEGAVMLVVYGGTTDPRDALPCATYGATGCGCRIAGAADRGDGALRAAGGFIDMGVRWLATTQTVGARALVVATSTFTPGGSHALHRHPRADEFFLVLQGGGEHLTQDGPVRLNPGDMAYIPAGEWHGFRTDPGTTTRTVYGYLGAGSLEQAGYELLEEET
ncbi:cupin domain-containing protein [Polyangium aurulentum]|uniref:cupin domain-containing protein n=1 Tax=Polyangium aurulentum TaxID=2567896 RepID=UPI0010ADAAE1|nr:cupin domain-containing protein [Polyangium aurulentum]UQA56802.1 cupin domain-containing protein [Polyangium aurulentum]